MTQPDTPDRAQDATPAKEGGALSTGSIRKVVAEFLPRPFGPLVQHGLVGTFLMLVAAIVVLPISILLLAALWLQVLGTSDMALAAAVRKTLLGAIHKGLDTEGVAAESHSRLDYLQWFKIELRPRSDPRQELRLGIKPGQKMIIDVRRVSIAADQRSCQIPEGDIDLVEISLGNQAVATLRREPTLARVDNKWWEVKGQQVVDSETLQRLTFRLTDEARDVKCGIVVVEGGIQVFKDYYALKDAE